MSSYRFARYASLILSASAVLAGCAANPVTGTPDLVFQSEAGEIKKALSNKGPGVFAIPGLVKVEKKKVPARPAQKNVPNPFKPGEFMDRPAKPASVKVKVRALKNLKDMV